MLKMLCILQGEVKARDSCEAYWGRMNRTAELWHKMDFPLDAFRV